MSEQAVREAHRFMEEEKQFHLGILPTEQSHPKTRNFSATIARNTAEGASMLLSVDLDIPPKVRETFESPEFAALVDAVERTVLNGGKVGFSGCGATGRLAIILEKMWRAYWEKAAAGFTGKSGEYARRGEASYSIMTGGDRALIRSVENFEDFQSFGARQVRDEGLGKGDLLVAITEGGETSSVIGTANEAADRGATVFFAYNNPTDVLRSTIDRSRMIIEREDIVKIDLFTGSMALTGSTRLQATTTEMLVVGAALEAACARILRKENPGYDGPLAGTPDPAEYAGLFETLVRDLSSGEALAGLASFIDLESELYAGGDLVTYACGEYLLDIISDTTERTPTFMLPPFRPSWDSVSPVSWAFVKDPELPTRAAWDRMLRRPPRGLAWTREDYVSMGGTKRMTDDPPKLDREEIYSYGIGNGNDPSRYGTPGSLLLAVSVGGGVFEALDRFLASEGRRYPRTGRLVIALDPSGDGTSPGGGSIRKRGSSSGEREEICIRIPLFLKDTPMDLFRHLAVKLTFNTASTGTMGKLGRIRGNWMIQVDATNKKLVDRATRLISQLGNIPYGQACVELHLTLEERRDAAVRYGDSAVVQTLKRLDRFPKE